MSQYKPPQGRPRSTPPFDFMTEPATGDLDLEPEPEPAEDDARPPRPPMSQKARSALSRNHIKHHVRGRRAAKREAEKRNRENPSKVGRWIARWEWAKQEGVSTTTVDSRITRCCLAWGETPGFKRQRIVFVPYDMFPEPVKPAAPSLEPGTVIEGPPLSFIVPPSPPSWWRRVLGWVGL